MQGADQSLGARPGGGASVGEAGAAAAVAGRGGGGDQTAGSGASGGTGGRSGGRAARVSAAPVDRERAGGDSEFCALPVFAFSAVPFRVARVKARRGGCNEGRREADADSDHGGGPTVGRAGGAGAAGGARGAADRVASAGAGGVRGAPVHAGGPAGAGPDGAAGRWHGRGGASGAAPADADAGSGG